MVDGDVILHRDRVQRPQGLAAQYEAVAASLRRCSSAVGVALAAVGVGIAGVVQHDRVMTAHNLGITSPTDVRDGVVGATGLPVALVNDLQATAAGLAHRWPDGLTAVLSMGTGVGGALVESGRLIAGSGAAGDFGHLVADVDGPACGCGGRGCLELYASGRVFAEAAARLAAEDRSALLAQRSRQRVLHAGDLQDAATGEPAAAEILERAAGYFAAGLRTIVACTDPDRIVLVGALLDEQAGFGRLVREQWKSRRPAWSAVELLHAAHDEQAALLGAARIAAAAVPAQEGDVVVC